MKERYEEEWRQIPGYEGLYDVSDFGRARSARDGHGTFIGRLLKPCMQRRGYYQFTLCNNGTRRTCTAHRLVMAAFVGPRPDGKEVNHKDGDKANNRLDNLEYVTPSENQRHAFQTGLKSNRGENHPSNKLTEESVHKIKRRLGKEPQKEIADSFNVAKETISSISTGKIWGYLINPDSGKPYTIILQSQQGEKNSQSKLTEDNVHEIRSMLGKETREKIAAKFDVSISTIGFIANGKRWSSLKEPDEEGDLTNTEE